jgi:hypothetical protein
VTVVDDAATIEVDGMPDAVVLGEGDYEFVVAGRLVEVPGHQIALGAEPSAFAFDYVKAVSSGTGSAATHASRSRPGAAAGRRERRAEEFQQSGPGAVRKFTWVSV